MATLPDAARRLFERQHGVCVAAQLAEIGFGERRITTAVRRGELRRLHRGAYALASAWSEAGEPKQHCMRLLAVQLGTRDAVARAETAVIVWGLPVRRIPDRPLVFRIHGAATAAGAVVSRSRPTSSEMVKRHGLRVVPVYDAVVETAAAAELGDGLVTVDAALRAGFSPATLLEAAHSRSTKRGSLQLRDTLSLGDPGSESWLESLSRGRAIEMGLPPPLCNVELVSGGRTVRGDLLWPELGVIGECDGKVKYRGASAAQVIWLEKRRHEWIESLGFEIARWGYPEVADNGIDLRRRVDRAFALQRGAGFAWPKGVRGRVLVPPGVQPLPRVVAEVQRLQELGIPIVVVAGGRRVA